MEEPTVPSTGKARRAAYPCGAPRAPSRLHRRAAQLSVALALVACPGRSAPPAPEVAADAPPARRAPAPPEPVHAYPPHAIRSDGVGPYLIGMDMKEVLRELPEGPHLELLMLGKYLNWRMVRSEGGALIIGGDAKNQVGYVAVLGAEVARTQVGVGVGVTAAELAKALGKPIEPGDVVRDRRVDEFESLPGVRFVTDVGPEAPADKAKVIAVVVARGDGAEPRAPSLCRTGGALASARSDVLQAARGRNPPPAEGAPAPIVRYGCVSAAAPEAIVLSGGELAVVAGEPGSGKLRRVASVPAPGAQFVGPLDVDGDGRDEIIWGAQHRGDNGELALEIHALRWDAGKLNEVVSERPIVIGVDAAAAAGVTPAQVELAVEVRASGGALAVGGIYLARSGDKLRELAPLQPVTLKVEPRHPAGPPPAEPPDAPTAVQHDRGDAP